MYLVLFWIVYVPLVSFWILIFYNALQYEVNPFYDEIESGIEPASAAYRYRKFTLGNVRLVARCELQSWITKHGEDVLMTCHALNG